MRLRTASAWGGPAESKLVAGLGSWQFWEPCMKKPEKPPDPTGKGCPHRESSAALTPALGASQSWLDTLFPRKTPFLWGWGNTCWPSSAAILG